MQPPSHYIAFFEHLAEHELKLCSRLNQLCQIRVLHRFLCLTSWLGNGKFWYVLIVVLPLIYGWQALSVSVLMAAAGLVALSVYRFIKLRTSRPRPFIHSHEIRVGMKPLDQYSFPSGHTLHAVNFSLIALHFYPQLASVLLPFTILTGLSRVVLGLHFPTDVIVGAIIGGVVAQLSLFILSIL